MYDSFTDERRAKEKSRSEPKYSFEELSDEEDSSGTYWKFYSFYLSVVEFICKRLKRLRVIALSKLLCLLADFVSRCRFVCSARYLFGLICFSEWWMSDECSPKEIRFFCDDLFCTSSQQGIELAHEWFSIRGAQQMQVISSKVKYHATSSGCNGSSSLFVSVSKLNNSWNYGL